MKFIADFVSVVLSMCILFATYLYVVPIINQPPKPKKEIVYPTEIRETLYIDRNFTEFERLAIIEAAEECEDVTNGIVQYEIVQLPSCDPIAIENALFIVKISVDEPEVLITNNQDNILAHYTSRKGLPTIAIIANRIEDSQLKGVIMHEIGHAIGLEHQPADEDIGTLMYPYTQITIDELTIDISTDVITKTDLIQFCKLYNCDADQLINN